MIADEMLQVEEAQRLVLDAVTVLDAESVPLRAAHGRVLREDVAAPFDTPEADNSAMDGYAVRAEDIARAPVSLRVIGTIAAGSVASAGVEPGTAMRIMTGALVPAGADTVVQVELTDGGLDVVEIREALPRGANIRSRGEDMRAGATVLTAGTPIRAAEVGILASVQKSFVRVGRRPIVAILSTGDELVDVDEARAPGKVVNSNAYAMEALVAEAAAVPRVLGIVRDTREATIAALEQALESDFVVTTGGVSVGAFDFVKDALAALGAETKFWRVAMKPGKPIILSTLRGSLVFGLPGNPVSCMVSFHLFVLPALRKAMGQMANLFHPTVSVRLAAPLKAASDRRIYYRVRVDAELVAHPMRAQGSGVLTSMRGANGLAIVEPDRPAEEGAMVRALLIGPVEQ
jgi:molybdopterin molybdotransferase